MVRDCSRTQSRDLALFHALDAAPFSQLAEKALSMSSPSCAGITAACCSPAKGSRGSVADYLPKTSSATQKIIHFRNNKQYFNLSTFYLRVRHRVLCSLSLTDRSANSRTAEDFVRRVFLEHHLVSRHALNDLIAGTASQIQLLYFKS